jgi:uncharacterized protein YbaP (TraB family)
MPLSFLAFLRPLWLAPALALAAAPALADTAPVAKLKVEAPAKAAAKLAPLVQDYEPRPAIWLLQDSDTRIYLFGTVHILPPGFRWRSPAVDRLAATADELVVESYDAPDGADRVEALEMMFLDSPRPLLERVPEARREALKAAIEASGVPAAWYDQMQTWAAAIALGVAQLLEGYGADDPGDAPGVEDSLEAQFREAGKPIRSVEDPVEVLASLNALPAQTQVDLLLSGFEEGAAAAAEAGGEEDRHWATGNAEKIAEGVREAFPPALYEVLLTRRNARWTGWLAERLEAPGTVLFAVGAAHLAGPDSVQAMLEARGLEVTRFD